MSEPLLASERAGIHHAFVEPFRTAQAERDLSPDGDIEALTTFVDVLVRTFS